MAQVKKAKKRVTKRKAKLAWQMKNPPKTVVGVLRKLRSLMTKKVWVKDAYMLDKNDLDPQDEGTEPVRMCLVGGLMHIDGPAEKRAQKLLLAEAREHATKTGLAWWSSSDSIEDFNDHSETTLRDVRQVIDDAIVRARKRR